MVTVTMDNNTNLGGSTSLGHKVFEGEISKCSDILNGLSRTFESWSSWRICKAIKNIWKMMPSCIFWCVWGRCLLLFFSWTNYVPVNDVGWFVDFIGTLSLAQ
ncbi:hypothetical protein H5410_057754 [Solanum commersonii]|uniref:Uncharacterized protein n=1 Tax=Solanum commersonii TaxID=4109 RepID=A0A9J5WR37_SOLCO|nr:hypothetical protein H5410_057754 [Solanum commersonii]